ncbi:Lectin C-type domain [Halocaridina rubra]|uniref:Lectin C-type domain n=1 Tax=Halocaridina rubra TaxID=373956 RepID=A0AAN8ZSG2_HALRR
MKLFLLLGLVALASAQFFRGPQGFRSRPSPSRSGGSRGGGGRGGGGGGGVDGTNGGSEYHYSWRHDGGRKYVHSGAVGYCNSLGGGWGPVSIESSGESSFINGVISSNRQEYIWTGGVKAGSGWRWLNGGGFSGLNWSHTGLQQRPQPDNREGNENCLAILNNFYRDSVKWHDVACHHTKPIICERRA